MRTLTEATIKVSFPKRYFEDMPTPEDALGIIEDTIEEAFEAHGVEAHVRKYETSEVMVTKAKEV